MLSHWHNTDLHIARSSRKIRAASYTCICLHIGILMRLLRIEAHEWSTLPRKETNKIETLMWTESESLWKHEIKIPHSGRSAGFFGWYEAVRGVWPEHIFDIGFLFGSRIARAITTAMLVETLVSSPPLSAAKISLFAAFLPSFLWKEVRPQPYILSHFLAHCFLWTTCLHPYQSTLFPCPCPALSASVFVYTRCPRSNRMHGD